MEGLVGDKGDTKVQESGLREGTGEGVVVGGWGVERRAT